MQQMDGLDFDADLGCAAQFDGWVSKHDGKVGADDLEKALAQAIKRHNGRQDFPHIYSAMAALSEKQGRRKFLMRVLRCLIDDGGICKNRDSLYKDAAGLYRNALFHLLLSEQVWALPSVLCFLARVSDTSHQTRRYFARMFAVQVSHYIQSRFREKGISGYKLAQRQLDHLAPNWRTGLNWVMVWRYMHREACRGMKQKPVFVSDHYRAIRRLANCIVDESEKTPTDGVGVSEIADIDVDAICDKVIAAIDRCGGGTTSSFQ